MFLLDLDSWSILEQIDFIYRATRITINFCSRSYGRVTTAHWKWLNFWKFAPSVLSVCSQFLSCLLQLQFSHPRRHFSEIFWLESTYYNLLNFQNLYQLLSYLENWACYAWFALNFLGYALRAKNFCNFCFFAFFSLGNSDTFYVC